MILEAAVFLTLATGTPLPRPAPIMDERPDTLDMLFLGDIMMHDAQLESARTPEGYDFCGYFDHIAGMAKAADFTVANMEFTVGVEPYSGYPCFSAPYEILEEAAENGIGIMLSANNHICDKGKRGLASTLAAYEKLKNEHSVFHTGVYKDSCMQAANYPLVIEHRGIKVALLNFTYGTNGIQVPYPYRVNSTDTLEIKEAILRAKADSADIIIALPHWGTEYRLKHDHAQERLAEWLVSNGADLVIGTHPHVPQDRDTVGGRHVIYSLGNFISNMSLANTQAGLAAKIKIVKRYGHKARIDSAECIYLWCSRPGYKEKGFTTVIINEMEGKRQEWLRGSDYDNMINSRNRIRKIINIR